MAIEKKIKNSETVENIMATTSSTHYEGPGWSLIRPCTMMSFQKRSKLSSRKETSSRSIATGGSSLSFLTERAAVFKTSTNLFRH